MRGLRAKGNFIDDWVVHEKEMNSRGFMGNFELRQIYEKVKRKALELDEEELGLSIEEMQSLFKSLFMMEEDDEIIMDKEKGMEEAYQRIRERLKM